MTIEHVILGLLSVKPLSGYDLKKIMQESDFMYWSGNNNQIYRSLLQLCDTGCAAITVEHRENAPLLKRYSITEKGLEVLREGVSVPAGIPEGKKPFLLHLGFAHGIESRMLEKWVDAYATELSYKIRMAEASANASFAPCRTAREAELWQLINANITDVYRNELAWLSKVRDVLARHPDEGAPSEPEPEPEAAQHGALDMELLDIGGHRVLYLPPEGRLINAECDALACVEACLSENVRLLLLSGERLSARFLRLRTGLAGAVLQKLAQYRIRTAIVYAPKEAPERFKDLIAESNRGTMLHVCKTRAEAEAWLCPPPREQG